MLYKTPSRHSPTGGTEKKSYTHRLAASGGVTLLDEFPRYPLDVLVFDLGAFGLAAVAALLTDIRPLGDFVARLSTNLLHPPLVGVGAVNANTRDFSRTVE